MNKSSISKVVDSIKLSTIKHSPAILTGIGITGMITATVMAVKATPKALDLLNEIKEVNEGKDISKKEYGKEIVTKVAPVYIPTVLVSGLSIACIISANSVSQKRTAALATAYTLSENALKEYQEKVIETIGEKKEKEVRNKIAQDNLDRNPVANREVIITTRGNTLCFDPQSGRYFTSDIDTLKRVETELNHRLLSEMYISLNDYYYEIGLRGTEDGDDRGWNINDGYIEFDFSSLLAEDGRPCLNVGFRVAPRLDLRNVM